MLKKGKVLRISVACATLIFVIATMNFASAMGDAYLEYDVPDMPLNSRCYAGMHAYWDDDYEIYSFSHWEDIQPPDGGDYEVRGELYENNVVNAQAFIAVQYWPLPSECYPFYAYVWCWTYPSYLQNPTHEEGDMAFGYLDSSMFEDLLS